MDRAILGEQWDGDVYGLGELSTSPAVVVDIVALFGSFTLLVSEQWPTALIVACEPDPDNLRCLC